jgi:hypothetical protein
LLKEQKDKGLLLPPPPPATKYIYFVALSS